MTDPTLQAFFQPRGVVVFGASVSPGKLGYGVAHNLVVSGYPGGVHFVGLKPGALFGRPIYTDLAEVPDPVELAVLVVPAPAVAEAVRACGERGIRVAIVISGGFRETGPQGAALEQEMLAIAGQYGMRLVGPNCVGLLETHWPMDTTFLPPPMPPAGNVALISHSGAFCGIIIDWARGQKFGFSRLISLGNQADVNETDMLNVVAEDAHTRVLTHYLEQVADGGRFVAEARRVVQRKPVIALKTGRFAAGQRAAASHTGALAGSDTAYDAAFEKAGVLRAPTMEAMFDWASALAFCPPLRGRRVAILSSAGGPGVVSADSLEDHGLGLAEFSTSTRAKLATLLPPAANVNNPVDMLASATDQTFADCLKVLLADAGVDGVLVIVPPAPMWPTELAAQALIPLVRAADKPVMIALMGADLVAKAGNLFRAANVVTFPFPERAAAAFDALARREEFLAKAEDIPQPLDDVNREAARDALAGATLGEWLDPQAVDRLLNAYGIPTAAIHLAQDEAEVAALADVLGFPLVVKVASADIAHKSDVGGVVLGVDSSEAVVEAFRMVTARARAARPEARIDGIHLQRMAGAGQEVILGATRDPQFGPLMMFGSGGVEVEGLRDVTFALGPLTEAETGVMLTRTWAGRKLAGFRSIPAGDSQAVRDVLRRLSWLVQDCAQITEIEINPLRVMPAGVIAIDARVRC